MGFSSPIKISLSIYQNHVKNIKNNFECEYFNLNAQSYRIFDLSTASVKYPLFSVSHFRKCFAVNSV